MTTITIHETTCVICEEAVPADGKHLHYCTPRNAKGKVLSREWVGFFDGNPINYGSDQLAIERDLDHYVSDLAKQTAIDTANRAAELSADAPLWACKACGGKHHIQSCPIIWYGPRTETTCISCGDPAIGVHCQVCIETGERMEQIAADRASIAAAVARLNELAAA